MKDESSNVMAFDALYTNNRIQKLKVLLPYIEPSMQKNMAVYIKFMELKYTMDMFRKHPFHASSYKEEREKPDIKKLFRELRPYCTESESRQLEQLESMFQTMEMYQEMSQTMSAMQEMFPNMDMGMDMGMMGMGMGDDNASGSSMMDMLMGMLTPEQKEMYEAFSNINT